jgi:adenylate kinase
MRLILLGCPGAGKGTQSKWIQEKYHIPAISTGDILRAAIQQASPLGKKVKEMVANGQLVPDEVVIQLVLARIQQSDCQQGFLLDGFPRTVAQAEALQHNEVSIDYIIDIDVPAEEIVKRLSGRRIHAPSGRIYHIHFQPPQQEGRDDVTGEPLIQRPDDEEETIRKRMIVYQTQTEPLRDYYLHWRGPKEKQPHYIKINGCGSVEKIKETIFSILDKDRS